VQLVIDTGLQVLIEESLQFLVLLIEQSGLLDQVLPVDEQCVVLGECLVESLPSAQFLVVKDGGHLLPENSLLSLDSLLLLFF